MIKWLLKVILILIVLTAFTNFVTTWVHHPESSILNPERFIRSYGDMLFANPLFWLIIALIFITFAWKVLRKGGTE